LKLRGCLKRVNVPILSHLTLLSKATVYTDLGLKPSFGFYPPKSPFARGTLKSVPPFPRGGIAQHPSVQILDLSPWAPPVSINPIFLRKCVPFAGAPLPGVKNGPSVGRRSNTAPNVAGAGKITLDRYQ
jgi:hypothetical protein